MASIWATNGGVYFGYGSSSTEGTPPPITPDEVVRYIGDRHIVTIGPNGSGKSRTLLFPNLAELTGWSNLVVDPKGELAHWTLGHRESHGNKIVRLNPFGVLGMGSDGFNPVAALNPADEDFPDDAQGLADALIRVEGNDPHWSQSAQELVSAFIMYVRLVLPDASLADVRYLLGRSSSEIREIVVSESVEVRGKTVPGMLAAAMINKCDALDTKSSRLIEAGPENRELSSVFSVALTQTRWLDSPKIQADLSKGTFDFSEMKQHPTTVYLILPARRLGTHSNWLRLMITSVIQPLMKDTLKAAVPVLLMLDEFAQLGHLPVIEQTVALMRGYGLKLWAVFQDLSQAKAIYGDRWESFVSNAGVLQSFAPQDVFTAEYLSKRTGQMTRTALSGGDANDAQAKLGVSQIGVPLMLPQDLRNMDSGYSVLFSNKVKGTMRTYVPYPTGISHLRELASRMS